MKTCSKCGKEKPFSEFARSRLLSDGKTRQADGYRTMCRGCVWQHEKNRRSKWTDAEKRAYSLKQQKYSRRWDDRNPLAVKASRANLHAKRVGTKGRLRVEDVIAAWKRYDGKCWVCGFPATELDHYRPINGKGGGTNTADNIFPICRECNQKRSHRWHGEVIAMKEAEMLKGIKELLHGSGGRQQQIVGRFESKGE